MSGELEQRYEDGVELMQAEGATVSEMPAEEIERWLDGMPNIAQRWVEATEARGYPAGRVLEAYIEAVRERGGEPLRDWTRAD